MASHHEGDRLGRLGLDGGVDDILDLLAEGVLLNVLLDGHVFVTGGSERGWVLPLLGGVTESSMRKPRSYKLHLCEHERMKTADFCSHRFVDRENTVPTQHSEPETEGEKEADCSFQTVCFVRQRSAREEKGWKKRGKSTPPFSIDTLRSGKEKERRKKPAVQKRRGVSFCHTHEKKQKKEKKKQNKIVLLVGKKKEGDVNERSRHSLSPPPPRPHTYTHARAKCLNARRPIKRSSPSSMWTGPSPSPARCVLRV